MNQRSRVTVSTRKFLLKNREKNLSLKLITNQIKMINVLMDVLMIVQRNANVVNMAREVRKANEVQSVRLEKEVKLGLQEKEDLLAITMDLLARLEIKARRVTLDRLGLLE